MAYTSVALLIDDCFLFLYSKPTDCLSIYTRQETSCISQSFRFFPSFQKYLTLKFHYFLFMLEVVLPLIIFLLFCFLDVKGVESNKSLVLQIICIGVQGMFYLHQ